MSYGGYGGGGYDNNGHADGDAPLMQGGGYNNSVPKFQGDMESGYPPAGAYDINPQQGGFSVAQPGIKGMPIGNNINDFFFAAACCIILASMIAGLVEFGTLKMVDFIQMTYLMCFGGVLAVLDTPILKTAKGVMDARIVIGKYIHFLTRVIGKGVAYVFVSSALFMTMWDTQSNGFFLFLAVILTFPPTVVGFGAIAIGVLKSNKLDKARRQVQTDIDHSFGRFAHTYPGPQGGLTMDEFRMLLLEKNYSFEPMDLKLIFNALVSNPSWRSQPMTQGGYTNANETIKIPKQDLLDWCAGGFVLL